MKYNEHSLYYRLNSNHLEYLLSTEPSFPFTIGSMLKEMREVTNWTKLSYTTVCELVKWLELPDYSPTSIESIFKSKGSPYEYEQNR
jgi:hypothetical protein